MLDLFYVGDPMCSWCYAFQPTMAAIRNGFSDHLTIHYVMGGLAKDCDQPMPVETQRYVQENWRAIEKRCDVSFNWDFWTLCSPRRSTYPACRAVIAAGLQQGEVGRAEMFESIQRAYYQLAKNPSDVGTLMAVAKTLSCKLDIDQFADDLLSPVVEEHLQADFRLRRHMGAGGFPSLLLQQEGTFQLIQDGWDRPESVVETLKFVFKQ